MWRRDLSLRSISSKQTTSGVDVPAQNFLRNHSWRGNVRELKNTCERLAILSPGDTIGVADPVAVTRLVETVGAVVGDVPLRCHFHNTRNTGLANAYMDSTPVVAITGQVRRKILMAV